MTETELATRPEVIQPGPAWSLLRELARGAVPMASLSAATVGHLTRPGWAVGCQVPNPYRTEARTVPGLRITDAGIAALGGK
jgi:hypothetical protein